MKFSMNGFRRSLSGDVQNLKHIAEQILNDDYFDRDNFIETVNELITASNVLNCVSSDEDELFDDLSDIEVDHLSV